MAKYTVRVYAADGRLAFGVTLNPINEADAVRRFKSLPLGDQPAELLSDGVPIAERRASDGVVIHRPDRHGTVRLTGERRSAR